MTDLLTVAIRIGGNDGRSDDRRRMRQTTAVPGKQGNAVGWAECTCTGTEVSFHLSQSALPVRR
jgi:hypothetical protein